MPSRLRQSGRPSSERTRKSNEYALRRPSDPGKQGRRQSSFILDRHVVIEGVRTEPEQELPTRPFKGVLGDTSELRIIEQLMGSASDYNISELARVTQVSRPTVHKAVRKLLECGVLQVHSTRGNMKFYGLNEQWSIGNVLTKVDGKQSEPDNPDEALMRRIQSPTYDRE